MKCTWIVNGRLSLTITPETDIEKSLVAELFKMPVETKIEEKLQVLNIALVDSVVITQKQTT